MTPERIKTPETTQSPQLNYIIVGYGNFGHKRHAVLGRNCIATVSRNPSRGADYLTSVDIPSNIVKKAEAVVVTTPDPAKYDDVKYWIERGKNVLVEKPFLATEEQLKALLQIAIENGVIWHTAFNLRSEPNIMKVKKLLDEKFIGQLYHARLCYGFGNAKQLIGSWRDIGLGVLADVGSHLIDLNFYLFGYTGNSFEAINLQRVEWSGAPDHCQFSTRDKKVFCEASMLHWKNEFTVEIFGKKGSLHMHGLCKWGESELLVRKRVLPAGVPEETRYLEKGPPDPTLENDLRDFEIMIKRNKTSFENDLAINQALSSIWSSSGFGK